MPGTSGYNPQEKDTKAAAAQEAAQRKAHHDKAWAYYNGEMPMPLKVRNGVDNNIILNLIKPHIDSRVSFAAPSFPLISLDGQEGDNPNERRLKELWAANRQDVWLSNVMLYGALEGHDFIRVMPDPRKGVRLVTLNPGQVLAYWAHDDFEQVLYYEVRYTAADGPRLQHFIAPGVANNAGWELREWRGVKGNQGVDYNQPVGDVVQFSYRPIVDWQHLPHPARFYGQHEMQGMSINDAINKTASDMKAILRIHASPRIIAIGVDKGQIQDTAIDSLTTIPGNPQDVEVKQLEMTGDLTASMNFLNKLSDLYNQGARVTQLTGGPDDYKGITNLGIKAAFKSQMEVTETIRRQYGWGIQQLSVAMMGALGVEIAEPSLSWADSLPVSEAETAQVVQIKRGMGLLSKPSAAADLGIDWTKEEALLQDEMPDGSAILGAMA